ncbi:UNVERIFIED_CONTAM: hypothetical protein Slati_1589400 [Sesamum latifolium]|uniref:CTLH domain-containing protein n=1 Tax=Sesamum latifolium TaxID=2727402 RepID=A0AAW2XEI6_9LAMI
MDSTPVNWEALDALVIDFAKSERLIDHSSPPSSPPPSSSSYRCRLLICQIRRFLESGDIDSATDLLRTYAPAVLDDHRLLFRLQKQACNFTHNGFPSLDFKFIELLRRGTNEDRDSAIKCVRTSLAPCALDAYPEAYEEFKHVLLAFIYDKDDQTSPVVNEWSERRRFEIAGLLSSVLRAHLHAYDPIFSMTLRFDKGFCLRQGVSSPITDLTERLLLEERDPPATPQESLFEAPPFDEVDIQALAHAVELTRQGAVDSLRFAKGDLHQAFQNELCRMRLDISVLDELVHEYCIYRGIVDSGSINSGEATGSQVTSEVAIVDQSDPGSTLSENCSIGSDSDMSVSSAHTQGSQSKMDVVSTQNADMEVEFFKLVQAGDHSRALKVASSHLGPLAAKDPALLKPLKETLLALLRSTEEPIGKHLSLDALATSLQFEGLLWINSLKELGSPMLGEAASKSTVDSCTQGSSQVTICSSNMRMQEDGSSPNQISSTDIGCDENAILKVMEFLALPRADAIHLLAQYNGNAETVIQQIFA